MANDEIQSSGVLSLNDYLSNELSIIFEDYSSGSDESLLEHNLDKVFKYWLEKKPEEDLSELVNIIKKSIFYSKINTLTSYKDQIVSSNTLEKLRFLDFFLKKIENISRSKPIDLEKKINVILEQLKISLLIDELSKELDKIEKIISSKKKKFLTFDKLILCVDKQFFLFFKTKKMITTTAENDTVLNDFFNDRKNINSRLVSIVFELYEKLNKLLDASEELKIALDPIFSFLMKFRITFTGPGIEDPLLEQSAFHSFARYIQTKEDSVKKEPRKLFSYKEPLKKESSSLFFKKNK